MAGTKAGGTKASQTVKERYGKDFFAKIGAIGGAAKNTKPKGFAANPKLARIAGRKGGKVSKRTKA